MATTIVPDGFTKRVRRGLVTSKNCVVLPAENAHTFSNGVTLREGDEMVFDLEACPKNGDLVLLWRDGGRPFVRCCEIAPLESAPRDQWCMGVLESDRESIVMIDLRGFERIGVFTGVAKAVEVS
ncbi:hypothetical protein [Dokdonella immobilis]|uniref:Peptidase S24-like n=1 Tax=Dokdonella immobilis TaxID=578942 RepID=A0A1I4VUW1_9GAMM|nr:hypothetical protein [Dokdonella immobilis]SFN04983.1 hypothetical protein SAMN05216289_10373 [Dokdonella immobilis]